MPNKGHPKAYSRGINQSKKVGLAALSLAAAGSLLFVGGFVNNTSVFGAEKTASIEKEVAVRQTLEQMRTSLATKETSLSLATKEISTLESNIVTKTAEKLTADTSIGVTQDEIAVIDAKLSTKLTEADRLALTAEKSTLQSSLKTLQITSDALSKEISTLQSSVTAKQAEVSKLQSEISTLKTQITQAELEQNLAPAASADTIPSASRTATTSYKILENDEDTDGSLDFASVLISNKSDLITAKFNPDTKELEITPSKSLTSETASIELSYTVADNLGKRSEQTVITVEFEAATKEYTAALVSTTTKSGLSKSISVADAVKAVAPEFDITSSSKQITSKNTGGVATMADDGTITYVANKDFVGTEVVTYEMIDAAGNKVTGSVEFVVEAPLSITAEKVSEVTKYQTPKQVDVMPVVLKAAGDVSMADSSLEIVSVPKNGTASIVEGMFKFTPDAGFIGKEVVSYEVVSPNGDVVTGEVEIEVLAPSSYVAEKLNMSSKKGAVSTVSLVEVVKAVSSELDLAKASIEISKEPKSGTAEIVGGEVVYTPNKDFVGIDTVEYTVTGVDGVVVTGEVEFEVEADAPKALTASEQVVTTTYNTSKDIDISNAVIDAIPSIDISSSSIEIKGLPENGNVVASAEGVLTYTPNKDYVGVDTVEYSITAENGGVVTGVISVETLPAGVVSTDVISQTMRQGETASVNVGAKVTSVDSEFTTANKYISADPASGTATMNEDGVISYTPNPGFVGEDVVEYTYEDEKGNKIIGTVEFVVETVTAAPQPVATSVIQPVQIDVDVDGVSNALEDVGPNGGDGNFDGILDSQQNSVASLPTNEYGTFATIVSEGGKNLSSVYLSDESQLIDQDEEFDFPLGLYNFVITDASATEDVSIYINKEDLGHKEVCARKLGPNGWYLIQDLEVEIVERNGQEFYKIAYSLDDNGKGDLDPRLGVISDPIGICDCEGVDDLVASNTSEYSSNVPKYSSQTEFDINNVNGGALVKTGADLSIIDMVILSSVVVFFAARLVQSTLMLDPREE